MFTSARLKLERADYHISAFDEAAQRFIDTKPYAVEILTDEQGWTEVHLRIKKEVPSEVGLVLGDAIHCLRCALDHAVWELFAIDGGVQDRYTKLPLGRADKGQYDASCNGMQTPRADTKKFLRDLGIHPNGAGAALLLLSEFDDRVKHHVITPTLVATKIGYHEIIFPNGGRAAISEAGIVGGTCLSRVGPGHTVKLNKDTIAVEIMVTGKEVAERPAAVLLRHFFEQVSITLDAFVTFVTDRP